jgi:hypothetical protein
VVLLTCLLAACTRSGHTEQDGPLRAFLQGHFRPYDDGDPTVRYAVVSVSLDDRTPMQLVYVSGMAWCGSGGCSALLVARQGASYRVLDEWSLVKLPICVLPGRTNGWHDIAMPGQGYTGPGATAVIGYDGKHYAVAVTEKPAGWSCDALVFGEPQSLYE